DRLIGPYILPFRLNGRDLEHVLPQLLENAPLNVLSGRWGDSPFQHCCEESYEAARVIPVMLLLLL
ncbi:hypothetical protein L9F63_012787, partial [Diploptera punctata]